MDRRKEEQVGSDWSNQRGIPIRSKPFKSNPFADEAVSISETTSDYRGLGTKTFDPCQTSFQLTAEVVELSSGTNLASVLTTV